MFVRIECSPSFNRYTSKAQEQDQRFLLVNILLPLNHLSVYSYILHNVKLQSSNKKIPPQNGIKTASLFIQGAAGGFLGAWSMDIYGTPFKSDYQSIHIFLCGARFSRSLYREQLVFPHFSGSLSRPLILHYCLSVVFYKEQKGKADIIIKTSPLTFLLKHTIYSFGWDLSILSYSFFFSCTVNTITLVSFFFAVISCKYMNKHLQNDTVLQYFKINIVIVLINPQCFSLFSLQFYWNVGIFFVSWSPN